MNGAAVVDELRDAFFTVKTNKVQATIISFSKQLIFISLYSRVFNNPLDKELFRIK